MQVFMAGSSSLVVGRGVYVTAPAIEGRVEGVRVCCDGWHGDSSLANILMLRTPLSLSTVQFVLFRRLIF